MFFAEILFVIFGTVIFYGLAASFYAKRLRLAAGDARGLVLIGAHPWARMMAVALKEEGVPVTLIDSNPSHIEACRRQGFTAYLGNIHSKEFLEGIDFSETGRALSLTSNAEINAFAEIAMSDFIGRSNVYHITVGEAREKEAGASMASAGSVLFGASATYEEIEARFYAGEVVRSMEWGAESRVPDGAIPLFCIQPSQQLRVFSSRSSFVPREGAKVLFLDFPGGRARPCAKEMKAGSSKESANREA